MPETFPAPPKSPLILLSCQPFLEINHSSGVYHPFCVFWNCLAMETYRSLSVPCYFCSILYVWYASLFLHEAAIPFFSYSLGHLKNINQFHGLSDGHCGGGGSIQFGAKMNKVPGKSYYPMIFFFIANDFPTNAVWKLFLSSPILGIFFLFNFLQAARFQPHSLMHLWLH